MHIWGCPFRHHRDRPQGLRVRLPRPQGLRAVLELHLVLVILAAASWAAAPAHDHHASCMPPRQSWRKAPPAAPVPTMPPLNEGFATPRASSSASAPASATQPSVPVRSDALGIQPYARGSKRAAIDTAADPEAREAAVQRLHQRVYAESNKGPHAHRLATWTEVAHAAGHQDAFAAAPQVIYDTAAALWQAGYRSIDTYLSAARQQMILDHGHLPEHMAVHFRRISRAAARGRGPSKQASGLPFTRFTELDDTATPLVLGGPCFPRRAAVIASWWMLRETEFANLTLDMVTFGEGTVTIRLPMSKEDTTGQGTARTLGCACKSQLAGLCPLCVLRVQVAWATEQAEEHGRATTGFPLFPTTGGHPCHKAQVSATVHAIAARLNLDRMTPSGAPLFSGHSFRVTGAQFMASCGIDVWRIQLHGRWGSASVLRYIRLSPLAPSLALEAALGRDLRQVQDAILAAKAELARGPSHDRGTEPLQQRLEAALGPDLAAAQQVLGKPEVAQVLEARTKHWFRSPNLDEILLAPSNKGQSSRRATKWHTMRPPATVAVAGTMEAMQEHLNADGGTAWCGWHFKPASAVRLGLWKTLEGEPGQELCGSCFGKVPEVSTAAVSSSSSDTSGSE